MQTNLIGPRLTEKSSPKAFQFNDLDVPLPRSDRLGPHHKHKKNTISFHIYPRICIFSDDEIQKKPMKKGFKRL